MGYGQNIKAARKAAGITQEQLAKRCKMATITIRQYETGKREPRYEQLVTIANALAILPGELLGTIPQPDREYEDICDTLNSAGITIEPTGWGDGSGSDGDHYYIWHTNTESIEEDRIELSFMELSQIIHSVEKDAEKHKARYIAQRLEAELFWPGQK